MHTLLRYAYRSLILLLSSAAVAVPAEPALAQDCPCAPKPDVRTALAEASVVLVGQADKVSRNPLKPGESEVRISVQKKLKGFEEVTTDTVILYTPDNKECGYEFRVGLDYLIYAAGTAAHFKVDRCSRTELLDNVIEEVQQLGALTRTGRLATSGSGSAR